MYITSANVNKNKILAQGKFNIHVTNKHVQCVAQIVSQFIKDQAFKLNKTTFNNSSVCVINLQFAMLKYCGAFTSIISSSTGTCISL